MRAGGDPYTEEDLAWRYQFLHQESIRTLSFYQGDTLVAVNIALVKENTVYDLACIINPLPDALKRSLGTVAILKNIAWSIEHGFAQYDLLSRDYGYKRQFGATEMKLKALIMGDESFFETYQIPDSLRWRV
jgi:CelD/BcsL family acetyltransferase involved in cellulose biosynthesis